jgi:hypothetical protein
MSMMIIGNTSMGMVGNRYDHVDDDDNNVQFP